MCSSDLSCLKRVAPDQLPHALPAQGAARAVQENRAAFGTEEGPPVPDIIQQQGDGRVVYGDEPLLTAFAQNAQQPRLRVEMTTDRKSVV